VLAGSERQVSPDLSGIHLGHLERYKFACRHASGLVLDAACGCGYGSKMLHDAGCVVTGIDLEPEAAVYADANYPGPRYLSADVQGEIPGGFDWVVSLETIEHVPDPVRALRNFRVAGSNLIISTPNEEFYPFDPEKFMGDKFPHLRHYTPEGFEWLLKDTGWEVLARFCQRQKTSHVERGTDGMFLVYLCR
jgi:2-polyprenyl-3-methyl-5-hydroxy-6-metoxy-1,4-benzoquinol methylase